MDFIEELTNLSSRITTFKDEVKTEEATKSPVGGASCPARS